MSLSYLDPSLEEWCDMKKAFEEDIISQEEYYEWTINCPDSSKTYRERFPEIYK